MSLGGFLDSSGGGGAGARVVVDMPYSTTAAMTGGAAGFSTPANLLASLPKYNGFNSPGLSLGLTNLDGSGLGVGHQGFGGGLGMLGAGGGLVDFDSSPLSRNNSNGPSQGHMATSNGNGIAGMLGSSNKDQPDGYDSRSGSDNIEGGSGDDLDGHDIPTNSKRKRYHRHTPQQIQELEALFKECPHPDEKQRLELSKRLNLESRQVKFWFQNRRTQMKTQLERHENSILKQENDRLKAENMSYREAMRNPMCNNCGSQAVLGDVSIEEQHLRFENARLKEELDRVYALAGKFLGRPVIASLQQQGIIGNNIGGIPAAALELAVGNNNNHSINNNGGGLGAITSGPMVPGSGAVVGLVDAVGGGAGGPPTSLDRMMAERSMFLEMALAAMDELVKLVQAGEPLWATTGGDGVSGSGVRETLRYDEYLRLFPRNRPGGFVAEATRESGTVIINSAALVEIVMDEKRWADIFSCMIARAESLDEISGGVAGTRNGALKLMHAELQVLSPLVPVRSSNFLRFCKQHAEGVWAVVDVSVDTGLVREVVPDAAAAGGNGYMVCRRLPSGFVVQDLPNGYSKVTWVEHAEYDETSVHHLYRPFLRFGLGFGASRWVAILHRQCECLAILMASTAASAAASVRDQTSAITPVGRKSMVKLAKRMTDNFCAGVCPSTVHKWNRLCVGSVDEDVRVMTRKSVNDPGEPPGVVLSAATSVWLPTVPPGRLFDFLRDERLRSEWDILSNGGPMQEMAHIAKGQDPGNCVSLLRASASVGANQSSMLILQETCTDESGSLVVYAPVDIPAMHSVMSGGDSAYVALLPSGFAIVPDTAAAAAAGGNNGPGSADDGSPSRAASGGSLLTVAFQILVNSQPTAKLTVESVETVNNLISCTVQKIKAAIRCDV